MKTTMSPLAIVLVTVLVTIAITVVITNFLPGEKKVAQSVKRLYSTHDPQFRRTMGLLLGPAIVEGNKVSELLNGDAIFPSMLSAIGGAKKSITFETYIYWSGDIGQKFADALSERARSGVKVHVLLDWIGSAKMDQAMLASMQSAGVEIQRFHAPHWYNLGRLNNRTHRKVLIVDGAIGFTGGVGIADQWSGNAQDPDHWRDTHLRVEGPVVAQMQTVFMDNWVKSTGNVLHGGEYFPALARAGESAAQMFSSSPSGGSDSMQLMYLLAITAADRSIELSSSYFVPDDLALDALVAAAKRGVRVRVITPGNYVDTETVRKASRARWGKLLEAGVEIYEFQATMFHCKVMVVDGLLVSVGSTNFDNRSFRLNDEANLNVFDEGFAHRQVEIFAADLAHSRRMTLAEWQSRPWRDKIMEHAASLIGAQL